jgi:hypothetical protein
LNQCLEEMQEIAAVVEVLLEERRKERRSQLVLWC